MDYGISDCFNQLAAALAAERQARLEAEERCDVLERAAKKAISAGILQALEFDEIFKILGMLDKNIPFCSVVARIKDLLAVEAECKRLRKALAIGGES